MRNKKQITPHFVGELVELDRDCELGARGARAVVKALDGKYMTLVFTDGTVVKTGADYAFLNNLGEVS